MPKTLQGLLWYHGRKAPEEYLTILLARTIRPLVTEWAARNCLCALYDTLVLDYGDRFD